MSFPLSAIGAVESAIGRAGSGVARGLHSLGKGLEFAGELDSKIQSITDNSGLLAQIAGLLQTGTPIALITNTVAKDLSGALLNATGNTGNENAQRTLQRALASALAPPGSSPPSSSGATQAASLEQRLRDILTKLMGQQNTAGQQSEFSGTVLDANSAKESPAQQTKSPTSAVAQSAPAAIDSFVQSLLSHAAATASAAAQATQAPPASSPALAQSGIPAANLQVQAQIQEQAPALPDILTRILTRAANADAQRNSDPVARTLPIAQGPSHSSGSNGTPSPATLFQRLIAVIAEEQAGSQSDTNSGKDQPKDSLPQSNQTQANLPASASVSAQAPAAPVGAQQVQSQPAATPYTTVDPQAIIEQVVKGIVTTNSGSTSEVRLRLQPDHLGDVSLKLTVTGNTITANVTAQNADVRDALLSGQQQLARSLAQAGLALGKFSVNVSGGNAGFTQQQSQQQQAKFGRSISVGGSVLSNEDDVWDDQRFGPPLLAGAGPLVLNYLA